MSKRKLVVEQDFGKRYCRNCNLWHVGSWRERWCSAFDERLESNERGWRRCQPCLDAEQPASAPLSLVLSVPKARG